MTTIGIIGAGHIGSQVARAAISRGYDVVISNSRGPATLTELIAELGPKAVAATPAEAGAAGDFVVVSVPLKNFRDVPAEPLVGKIVIDTNNYYPERDGQIAALDSESDTVSGMLQAHLSGSRVVKGFNHIPSGDITTDTAPSGTPHRRALAIAGNDAESNAFVAAFLDELGFDSVDVGPLADSWRVERDQPAYVIRQDADELRANLALAVRDKNSK